MERGPNSRSEGQSPPGVALWAFCGALVGMLPPAVILIATQARGARRLFDGRVVGPFYVGPANIVDALWPGQRLLERMSLELTADLALALLANASLYGSVGAVAWIGLHQSRAALYALGALIAAWWLTALMGV
jgi:hypothetical protein